MRPLLVSIAAALSFAAEAPLGGARIWYQDSGGAGVPVVLLHAASSSSAVWEQQISTISAAGFRTIAYDRRGYGKTVGGGDAGSAVDDLLGLLNYLKIDRAHLVGTAAGGGIVFDFVLSHPDRVRSLVVANSIGNVRDADYLAMSNRLRPQPQFDALPVEFRELGPSYRAANSEGTAKWAALAKDARNGDPVQRPKNSITFTKLESLRLPVLLITGDADLYTPPSVLRLFVARIKNAETAIVPESGHSAFWENPEFFTRRVMDFISKH